ncbi:unnamed protein product [Orchesella dallaii]|uniref:Uncharacterized protein n=1 Tax=Orchesella dallaii TaxID=48710 RepID=A0ABP1QKU4_9HEXA
MIDYLLIVLLFAFVPIGIILLFIGCFYCFLFIQYCATYTAEDEEENTNNYNDTRREGGDNATTTYITVVNESRTTVSTGNLRETRNASPERRRLGLGLPFISSPVRSASEEPPPPPYNSICFIQDRKDEHHKNMHNSTV